VGDRVGETKVQAVSYGENFNYGSVQVGVAEGETVELVTIDSLNLPRLDLLIADVEGYEEAVLIGAEQSIHRFHPSLYLENNIRAKSPDLLSRLFSLGYRAWWHLVPMFHPGNGRGVAEDIFGGMITVNMLCLPQDRVGSVSGMPPITSVNDWWQK